MIFSTRFRSRVHWWPYFRRAVSDEEPTPSEGANEDISDKSTSVKSKSSTSKKSGSKNSPKKSQTKSKSKLKPKSKIRVAHEMPADRRREIKQAMAGHKKKGKPEWDRSVGVKQHKLLKKRFKAGTMRTIEVPLLDVQLGDPWLTPITVIHGARPGPVVTVTGGIHGDELTGPSAATHLLSNIMTDPERPLNPSQMAGTLQVIPILNPPGYRSKLRYFPDGRDLNREFPGRARGNTTSRVAYRIWNEILSKSDYIIDLHSAAKGRTNLPQIRADLANPICNIIAKAFGIETILDSRPPRGSLRRVAGKTDIGVITYEGGGADVLDNESVKVAVYGVLNVLKSLHVIPGHPSRPRFRLLATGSNWLRAGEGGLLDMLAWSGSIVQKGDVVATISDPGTPGLSVDIVAPGDGLLICTATNPFVNAGTPVGHFLPLEKYSELLLSQSDERGRFMVSGSQGDPPWRDELDVDEIEVEGEWSGGSVDAEWQRAWIDHEAAEETAQEVEDA